MLAWRVFHCGRQTSAALGLLGNAPQSCTCAGSSLVPSPLSSVLMGTSLNCASLGSLGLKLKRFAVNTSHCVIVCCRTFTPQLMKRVQLECPSCVLWC